MPRHEQISPEEDLATFYGAGAGGPPRGPGGEAGAAATPVGAAPAAGGTPGGATAVSSGAAVATPAPAVPASARSVHEELPVPGAHPDEPASEMKRVAPVQRPMPTFPEPAAPVADAPNPLLAAVLSAVFPGAGQIYAGQALKGGVLLVVALFTCMGGGLFNVIAAIDAFLIAQRRARGETVRDWQFF